MRSHMPRSPAIQRFGIATAIALAPSIASAAVPSVPVLALEDASAAPEISRVSASVGGLKLDVDAFTLDNGLRVFVVEDHSMPTFAIHTAFAVGSRNEEKGRTGFAHLFEHMMFKGSANVPDGGHFKYVSRAGGVLNAFTNEDITQYFDILPSHALDRILWLESDRLRSLEVTQATFENQRAAVLEERAMSYENQPYAQAISEFFTGIWPETGYGHPVIGSKEDLNAAKTSDVQAFFDTYYVPANAAIAIVGDVRATEVRAKMIQYYGDLPDTPPPPAFSEDIDHTQDAGSKHVEDVHAQSPLYIVGWKTVPKHHPDYAAIELLMDVLWHGESSRLTKLLKDDKRMVVGTFQMNPGGLGAGVKATGFIPAPGNSFGAIKTTIRAEIDKVKARGLSANELTKAKNQLLVGTVEDLATNHRRALKIAYGAASEGDPLAVLHDLQKYQAVTAADTRRVARKYLSEQWLTLEIVPQKQG